MAELVDALASGASGSNTVQVQVLPRAPEEPKKNPKTSFGFFEATMVL